MNQTIADIDQFISQFKVENSQGIIGFAPQAIHLRLLIEKFKNKNILIGTQDCSSKTSGAFTGELSAKSIADVGGRFSLIGHSERRQYHFEKNSLHQEKIKQAVEAKLIAVYCFGETLAERENHQTFEVLKTQLAEALANSSFLNESNLVLAYEPVWAIGTGKTATPEQAQEVHAFVRQFLKSQLHLAAEQISILYGGSVNPNNVAQLLNCPDIDGGLVGGASLKAQDFSVLCSALKG